MRGKRKNTKSKQLTKSSFVRNLLKGFFFEVIVGMLLVFLTAYLVYIAKDPDKVILPISLIALYTTAFIGGALSFGINKNAPLICGGISGLMLLGILSLMSAAVDPFPYEIYSSSANVIIHFATLPISLLGAAIMSKLRTGNKIRKRAKRKKA